MRLWVARLLMVQSPRWLWLRLPDRLRSWAVDEWMWAAPSVAAQFASRADMRRSLRT